MEGESQLTSSASSFGPGRGVGIKVTLMQTAVQFCNFILTWQMCVCVCVCVCICMGTQSCLTLCYTMDFSLPTFSSMEFPRQEYWSGLPFPPSEDLPEPGIKPRSPALASGFFFFKPLSLLGSPDKYELINKASSLEVFSTVTKAAMWGTGDGCDRLDWVPLCFLCVLQVQV